MKRLLFRYSALATLIALGLIAIAQAQRSAAPETAPAVQAPANLQIPTAAATRPHPLRSGKTTGNGNPLTSRPGTPAGQQPALAPTGESLSLSAATDTGMVAPNEFAMPTVPNFGPDPGFASTASATDTALPPVDMPMPQITSGFPSAVAASPGTIPPMAFPETPASPIPGAMTFPDAGSTNLAAAAGMAGSPMRVSTFIGPQLAVGNGQPGLKELEGVQAPRLVIEKIAPAEIQVDRPAIFEIHVRNVGTVAATKVEIHDEIPKGTRLESTTPQAAQSTQGGLVWEIGTLQPNEDVTVEMELMPTDEGEIGSVATVHFQTEASVRTRSTRPRLAIETKAVEKTLKGEELRLTITVSNPGTGVAENVVIEEHVPDNFRHPAGSELEYEVGDLAPGESRELELVLEAVHPGPLANLITARGEPNLRTQNEYPLEVIAPQLEVDIQGPAKRYLECEAVYNLSVLNPGTAPAKQVELAVAVPHGMQFVSGTNRAYYEEATRTVHWMLEEIPVQDGPPPVQLTLMPTEAGQHMIRLVSTDDSGVSAEVEQAVLVDGIAAMYFEVADLQDPIAIGEQTAYEIRVVNQGSKEATNVQLMATLPPGMRPVAAKGPTQHSLEPTRVIFAPLPRLAPKADTTYQVRVQGVQAGDLRLKVQVVSSEIPMPITKEESTRVYSDQ